MVLWRGESDWFRKRELRLFDPSYNDSRFKQPLLFSPEKEFGAFVEDTILVTGSGGEVLSTGLPATVEEIEAITEA